MPLDLDPRRPSLAKTPVPTSPSGFGSGGLPAGFGSNADVQAGTSGLLKYMQGIYNYMAGALVLTGLVAFYAAESGLYARIAGTPLIWVVLFAPLVLALVLGFGIQRMSLAAAQVNYWAYAALMGLSLGGVFLMYTGESISRVFFISAGTFGAMSFFGYTTKKDLSGWGSFLLMGLIGVVIASIVNIFLKSSALQFAVSVIGVLVFVGLTAYDTQKIKAMYAESDARDVMGKKVVLGALTLYLDFINLFMMLLRLFGNRR